MAATLTRGITFGATDSVTNTKLHQLIESATIANIDQTNMASGYGTIVRSTSAPSDTDAIWVDTNCSPPVVKVYDGTEWTGTGSYAVLTNKSGGSIAAGDVVVADTTTAGSFTTTNSAGNTKVLGVAMQSISSNADGIIALAGSRVTNVAVTGTTAIGDYLKTSTTVKQAVPTATYDQGCFAIALSSRTGAGAITEALLIGTNGGTFTPSVSNALTGSVIQTVNTQTGAVATGTTQIPHDDTIPQNTEGDQYMSLSITPNNASNKLKITFTGVFSVSNGSFGCVALFQDSTAAALAATNPYFVNGQPVTATLVHYMTAGTTSPTTFKIRAGGSAAGTTTFNGDGGARTYGGVLASSITIEEIKA